MDPPHTAHFRVYAELNDFLPPGRRQIAFDYPFQGSPAIKDAIEAIGIPHPEVDLILVNGRSVDFTHRLAPGERVSVYPVFEGLDITPVLRLRARPLRVTRFVLDTHLGTLARRLRLLGFDARYRNDYSDRELLRVARDERRVILTRDRGLLKVRTVTHGYCVRASDPDSQVREVLSRLDLRGQVRPFTRCTTCNGTLGPVARAAVAARLPPRLRGDQDRFMRCAECGRIYWRGTHYDRLADWVERVVGPGAGPPPTWGE